MTAADHRRTLTKAALEMELNHRRAAAQQPTAVRRAPRFLNLPIVGHIQDAQLAGIRNGNDNPAVGAAQIVMRMRGLFLDWVQNGYTRLRIPTVGRRKSMNDRLNKYSKPLVTSAIIFPVQPELCNHEPSVKGPT